MKKQPALFNFVKANTFRQPVHIKRTPMNITQILSQELSATAAQITAAVELLDDGATVPFIARYRKEATGG